MNDFFVNDLNALSAKEDKYYLMNDVDRFSDAEFATPEEAEAAMEEAESELDDDEESTFWIARGDRVNDRIEYMFYCGHSA